MDPPDVTIGRFFLVPDGMGCNNRTPLYVCSWVSSRIWPTSSELDDFLFFFVLTRFKTGASWQSASSLPVQPLAFLQTGQLIERQGN